jgi:hypothetical protein
MDKLDHARTDTCGPGLGANGHLWPRFGRERTLEALRALARVSADCPDAHHESDGGGHHGGGQAPEGVHADGAREQFAFGVDQGGSAG